MKYWLVKSEPKTYSIDDLKADKSTCWEGVRNYQARNFMRDEMKNGDPVLFYHSNSDPSGVAGIARVSKESQPDMSALDKSGKHFDPRSTRENPVWMMAEVTFVERFKRLVSLEDLKNDPRFKGMLVTRRGMRLSIQPVDKKHFETVVKCGRGQIPIGSRRFPSR